MISFVVPAHNEAASLPACLGSIVRSVDTAAPGQRYEIVVVNDASTDATRAVAARCGARVIDVELRQIASVRNAGAKATEGDPLIFLDADTELRPEALRAALDALDAGAVGGGGRVEFDELRWHVRPLLFVFIFVYTRIVRLAAGCFVFARRAEFEAVGGFDESRYYAEEVFLTLALRKRGRFVIVPEHVVSSARKFRWYGVAGVLGGMLKIGSRGLRGTESRDGLGLWYDSRREDADE